MDKKKYIALAKGLDKLLLLYLPTLLLIPRQAKAYIDPGSGAYIYQAICAVCLGGLYYFRRFVQRFWKKRR